MEKLNSKVENRLTFSLVTVTSLSFNRYPVIFQTNTERVLVKTNGCLDNSV